jgi:hypothetical protein
MLARRFPALAVIGIIHREHGGFREKAFP